MLRPPKLTRDAMRIQGTTLIELVIALTIFTVLGVVVVTAYQRTQNAGAAHQARASTQTEITQIVTMIGKDLGVLDHGVAGNPNCEGAVCTIKTRKGQRRYTSSCAAAPATLAAADFSAAVPKGCLSGKAAWA